MNRTFASAALVLLAVAAVASIYALNQNTALEADEVSSLVTSYAERFNQAKYHYMQIEWVIPANLPELTRAAEAIVYGEVVGKVDKPANLSTVNSSLGLQFYEVKVYSILKKSFTASPDQILVSQVVGEAGNPMLQPGDRCVFFLSLWYSQEPNESAVYSLAGDYTRYVVYDGMVYSVASLNPDYDDPVEGEPLSWFLIRVYDYMN